ncbi:MAG: barstar family protein [Atopobiaceae bacterium]|nr:barstar family protein [Atopobiaceae bacterium]
MSRYRKITLREGELESPAEAHRLLAQELDFPDYYGANLDALEDCLGDVCEPTRIVLKRSRHEPKPWFDGFVEVVAESAQRSCFLGCVIR